MPATTRLIGLLLAVIGIVSYVDLLELLKKRLTA